MRRYLYPTLLFFLPHWLAAQNLLPAEWRFKKGDDMAWATPAANDSAWANIKGGKSWENQGYPGYDGYAWYRQTITIPENLKANAERMGGFVLELGAIDDADETFFNGKRIGATGKLPPENITAYEVQRRYDIPVSAILWGKPNSIAVRVYDGGGGGGMCNGASAFRVKNIGDLLTAKPVLPNPDHVMRQEEPFALKVALSNKLPDEASGNLNLEIFTDFKEKVKSEQARFKLKSGQSTELNFNINLPPGFYRSTIQIEGGAVQDFWFAVAPEKVLSPSDAPADLADYWQRARRELDAVAPQFRLIPNDSLSSPTRKCYLVEMRSLGNVLVRGWYMQPRKEGVYPAILHLQGYASNMIPAWGYGGDDMAVFCLNIRGHGNSKDNVNPGFPGYLQYFVTDKEQYIYRGAYMDCIRALDFLCSRPEVDKGRLAVEGTSQGGALCIATAALDKRVKVCAPNVPFLGDFPDYIKLADWPAGEFSRYLATNPNVKEADVFRTLSYIDTKNLASWVHCPVLMSVGLRDNICPPHTNFAAFNNMSVPREFVIYPEAGHSVPAEHHDMKTKWIKAKLGMQ